MLNVGDCVMIFGNVDGIEAGSFGKVLELQDSMAVVMCGKNKIRVSCSSMVKVLRRKIRIGELKCGDVFSAKFPDDIVRLMRKATGGKFTCYALPLNDGEKSYVFDVDYQVIHIELITPPAKKEERKPDVVILEMRFSTIFRHGKPWGVACHVTLSEDGMKTTVQKTGASYTNFDVGDVFDYQYGCDLALKRAMEQKMVKTKKLLITDNSFCGFKVKIAI